MLLNLAPDHLDRHGTFEAYRAAKLRAFATRATTTSPSRRSALGVEDLGGCARRVCFGAGAGAELAERAGELWWDDEPLLGVGELRLRGAHNRQNAMAAAAVCLARGVDPRRRARRPARRSPASRTASRRSPSVDGVLYVNDSKATNVASTLVALAVVRRRAVHLIAGGRGKGRTSRRCATPVAERCARRLPDRRGGATRSRAALGGAGRRDCGDLEHARRRRRARRRAPGDVVLLSPACASYDQYRRLRGARRALQGSPRGCRRPGKASERR